MPDLDLCNMMCANFVDYVLEKEGDVAALVAEPIRSIPYIPPPGFWQQVRKACDRHGTLLIFDEIPNGLGKTGRMFACEHDGVVPDILVLGKALGGASGGYTSGRAEIIEFLRQRSRPYLFSNTVAPSIVAASIKAIDLLNESTELRDRLEANTNYFREQMAGSGFHILEGEHPITPIMLGDAALASRFADTMLDKGVYVIGFSFPVVPKGKARIRIQISAAHTKEDLEFAIAKFSEAKTEMGI